MKHFPTQPFFPYESILLGSNRQPDWIFSKSIFLRLWCSPKTLKIKHNKALEISFGCKNKSSHVDIGIQTTLVCLKGFPTFIAEIWRNIEDRCLSFDFLIAPHTHTHTLHSCLINTNIQKQAVICITSRREVGAGSIHNQAASQVSAKYLAGQLREPQTCPAPLALTPPTAFSSLLADLLFLP